MDVRPELGPSPLQSLSGPLKLACVVPWRYDAWYLNNNPRTETITHFKNRRRSVSLTPTTQLSRMRSMWV